MDEPSKSTSSSELRLDAVIAEYLQLQDRGFQVDKHVFIAQYPDLAEELEAFFQDIPALDSDPRLRDEGLEACGQEDTSDTRYSVSSLHASGGIGRIYIAQDDDLRRKVALKSIHPRLHDHPVVQARFLREAQITGQLEHPHIVPVYELVRNPEGVVRFYTMRLVRGKTLRAEIREYYKGQQQDRVAFHRLVAAFLNVCHAVDYAHSRAIIHRDLKPDNVMIGKFGEVALMDWGLAKYVTSEEVEGSAVQLSAVLPGDVSTPNFEPGTPAYMSPEQAKAESHRVDRRTDVYGLGAILFELLTNEVPHIHQSGDSLKEQIASQASPDPLARRPDAPRALVEICRKAMAYKPEDRYPTAKQLANDIERWLADEPVSVYVEPIVTRVTRWVRRHRVAASMAAGIVAAASLAAAVWWVAEDAKDRLALEETSRFLGSAEAALDGGELEEAKLRFSKAQLRAAGRPRLKDLHASATDRLHVVETVLNNQREFAEFHYYVAKTLTAAEVDTMLGDISGAQEHCLAILERYDTEHWEQRLSDENLDPETVQTSRQEMLGAILLLVAAKSTAAYDNSPGGLEEGLALLSRGTTIYPDSRALWTLKAEYLSALGRRDDAKQARARASEISSQSAFDFFVNGEIERRSRRFEAAVEQYERALQLKPQDFWSYVRLADCWGQLSRPHFALACYNQALRLRPDAAWLRAARAVVYADLRMWKDATADLTDAERIDPDFYGISNNRGVIYVRQAMDTSESTTVEERIALLRNAEAEFYRCTQQRPSYAGAWNNLGRAYQELGELAITGAETDGAPAYYARASQAFSTALELDSRSTSALINRGIMRAKMGDFDGARADAERARRLDPLEPAVYLALGEIALAQGEAQSPDEADAAEAHYRAAAEQFGRAIELAPYDAACYLGRARARFEMMQQAIQTQGSGARESAKAILIDLDKAESYASQGFPSNHYAQLLGMRGTVWAQLGNFGNALADYTHSLQLEPDDETRHVRRGWALIMAASQGMADFDVALAKGDLSDARLEADAYAGRAYLLALAGDDRAAVAAAERAVELASDHWPTLFNAACSYGLASGIARHEQENATLAEEYARRAIDLLQQSVDHGLYDPEMITEERALVSVCQRPDFAELVRQLADPPSTRGADAAGR